MDFCFSFTQNFGGLKQISRARVSKRYFFHLCVSYKNAYLWKWGCHAHTLQFQSVSMCEYWTTKTIMADHRNVFLNLNVVQTYTKKVTKLILTSLHTNVSIIRLLLRLRILCIKEAKQTFLCATAKLIFIGALHLQVVFLNSIKEPHTRLRPVNMHYHQSTVNNVKWHHVNS